MEIFLKNQDKHELKAALENTFWYCAYEFNVFWKKITSGAIWLIKALNQCYQSYSHHGPEATLPVFLIVSWAIEIK